MLVRGIEDQSSDTLVVVFAGHQENFLLCKK
jgi:hypothetical protein